MAKILVIEDNERIVFGVTSALEVDGHDVIAATDGPSGVAAALEGSPDVIILDVMLPGFDGIRVLRTLRERGNMTPVLMLTAKAEEEDKVRGLRLGADDYLTKPFGVHELLARVEALLRRRQPGFAVVHAETRPAPRVIRFGEVEVHPASRVVRRNGEVVSLRPREFELLMALIDREGAVASRVDLLQQLWGYDTDVVTRTIDIHVAELRRKLEIDPSQPCHLITVWKAGYRFQA